MSNIDTPSQRELDSFDTVASQSKTSLSQGPEETSTTNNSRNNKSPLDELYEDLRAIAPNFHPTEASSIPIAKQLIPDTKHHTTKDLPEPIPALPFKIGHWELATTSSEEVIYATSGDAYDHRWGKGGSLAGVEVYLNNRGHNKDGKYHRRSHTLVGFENGDQIRQKDVDSKSDLVSVRGFNPGENSGDHGVGTGTETKANSAKEAVLELLLHLHHRPGPLDRYVTTEPEHGWSLEKLSPRSARWSISNTESPVDEALSLSILGSKVKLRNADETRYTLPKLESVPTSLRVKEDRTCEFTTPAAAMTAVNEILSMPPSKVISAGPLK